MRYFFDFLQVGKLKMDKVFFENYYPILFTCINEKDEHYLCVCCKATANEKKWLITKISPQVLIRLLEDKVTIRDAFMLGNGKFTIHRKKEGWEIQSDNHEDWDYESSIYLPTADEFIDADEGEFKEEIAYYREIISKEIQKI